MRIVFFGTPEFAVPSLERLLAAEDIEVVAVVTQPDRRRGRGSKVMASPVKQVALQAGCPIYQPQRIKRDTHTLESLGALQADAFVVVAYGQILSQQILAMPCLGCINAHGSLLPAYRGAAPIQWCLYHGEEKTGVTTMLMDAGMDTGAMLLKREAEIALTDNALDLAHTLSAISADLLVDTLAALAAGTITPIPQDEAQATYAPLIQKSDFALDWSKEAIALHNQVRGFYPNCVTQFREEPLKVLVTAPLDDASWPQLPPDLQALRAPMTALVEAGEAQPGQVLGLLKPYGPVVQTGSDPLLLLEVKPSGKRAQSGTDFANGCRLTAGEMFHS
ncbi:methionyl-tRNA formyltransferase [filamentous cyanobacterium CCP5]|nr:methionyl-tRNA formyltransferase [filamentous cyanobacterium CCP5]